MSAIRSNLMNLKSLWRDRLDNSVKRVRSAAILLFLPLLLGACVTLPRASFTAADQAKASPPGFSHIRYTQDQLEYAANLRAAIRPDAQGHFNVLAISGGGANGAYGAGLLQAWARSGQEPQFQIITGVSTGALTAPLVFAGGRWADGLEDAFSGPQTSHLLQSRGLGGLFDTGLFSKAPLEQLVRRFVTDDLVSAIAAEHAKGRRLLVGTTDLDTGQLVIWDMGAIASKGGTPARELMIQVLVASASVPGVFPPSMIPVQSGRRHFTEMHVDGQTDSAFFAIPLTVLLDKGATAMSPFRLRLYVLINGQLDSAFAVTPRSTIPILTRTIAAGAKASIRALVLNTFEFCHYRGCDLMVASMPLTLSDAPLDFSAAHLSALYTAGVAAEQGGETWRTDAPLTAPTR